MAFKMKGFSPFDKNGDTDPEVTTVAGQSLVKVKGGYKDEDSGVVYKDPNNKVIMSKKAPNLVQDESYTVKGNVITGVK
tara:strand:- start:309 stop:545 length:237 start_codon:yes stop_codon:yes gene_type:complete